nr:reverse transcriptase domain-containing protein [Tanacetum cinerariifolium]
MSTRSSARNLFPPIDNLELTIRRRSHVDPTLLNDFEMATEGNNDLPVPDLRTMEELCQQSLNGRGRPIAPIAIQATNFGLNNDMIQQSIKVNGVTDDALRLYLFPHSLIHLAIAWFDCLPENSINTFEQMAKKFLRKYFPPSMVTKLRNEITNFRQRPDESLFEAWERYKLSIDRSLKAEMAEINKNLMRVLQVNQQVKAVTPNCKTCGGPHSLNDCPATVGQTQNVYAAGSYQGNNQGRNQFFQGASHGQNPPPAYQAPTYQAPVHQPQIPQPQVVTTNEFTNFMKANDAILKNMQTNMTSLTNSNLELKNMFGEFMKMNTASSLGSETLPCNTITNPKEELKGITTRSGTAYQGPTIPTSFSSLPLTESPILNSEPVAAPIIEPIVSPVNFDADPRVPLILGRSFLKTRRALIDVFGGELTLRVGKEAITFNLDQTSRYSANYNDMMANRIDVIDMACEEYSQEVLGFFDVIMSGNPTPYYDPIVSTSSSTLTPFGESDFLLEEVDAFLVLEDDPISPEVDQSYVDTEEDITLLEAFLNNDPSLPPPNQGNYLPQDLPPHFEYTFLEGDDKLPVITAKDLSAEEKTALITVLKEEDFKPTVQHQRRVNPKIHDVIKNEVLKLLDAGLIYPISDSPWRCMMAIFHDMIEKTMEVFMDDFLVFRNSFQTYLSHLEKMLKWCEDTNLCLNWEKSHFMVKEGIALGHKISNNGIEVDKAKVDVIAKLPHPTTVKGIRSFLGHAGFYRQFIKYFSKIARPMTSFLKKIPHFSSPKSVLKPFKPQKKIN